MQGIRSIALSLPFGMGSVNCYLVDTGAGFVLIDTGSPHSRSALENELAGAGCSPGNLGLVLLTHGDFDHTGNAAYLRENYGAQIAIHRDDSGMIERGDMFSNRTPPNVIVRALSKVLAPLLFGFGKSERCNPDLYLEDGQDLSKYGFDARAISIPGHSKGSIGVLTAAGDLFCGDLFTNTDEPVLSSIMDDVAAAHASVEKLKTLGIETVYPGHGEPFPMNTLLDNLRETTEEKS